MQAFVQFLDQESRPKGSAEQMPNLLNITQTCQMTPAQATARRASTNNAPAATADGNTSLFSKSTNLPVQQPLLLNTMAMENFVPNRNSSSILKDILNDT